MKVKFFKCACRMTIIRESSKADKYIMLFKHSYDRKLQHTFWRTQCWQWSFLFAKKSEEKSVMISCFISENQHSLQFFHSKDLAGTSQRFLCPLEQSYVTDYLNTPVLNYACVKRHDPRVCIAVNIKSWRLEISTFARASNKWRSILKNRSRIQGM